MPGKNVTGLPNPDDYVLGRGKMYLSEIDQATQLPLAWRFVGNVPSMSMTVNEENLDHYESYESTKERDKRVTLQKEIDLSWSFDEINDENLSVYLSGEQVTYVNPAVAGFAEYTWIAPGDLVALVIYFQLADANGDELYGVQGANLTLNTTNGVPVTLVEGTDYVVDERAGLIRFLDSVEVGVAIAGVEGIDLTVVADVTAVDMDEVRALSIDTQYLAMLFNAVNPVNEGELTSFKYHKVKISSDGEMPMISDDWQTMPLSGSCDKNILASPDSPYVTIRTPLGS